MEKKRTFKDVTQEHWGNSILNLIRQSSEISKTELCSELGISITSVNNVLRHLVDAGYVKEAGYGSSSGGRKPGLLTIRSEGAFFIGLEFSADGISCAVLNLNRSVHYKKFLAFNGSETADYLVQSIIRELDLAIESVGNEAHNIRGIGIGASGYIDYEQGVLAFYTQNPNWTNIPLVSILSERFAYPVFLKNNIDVMPYAYKWVCCNGSCEDHVMMAVRYGFKISAFANNQRIKGAHDFTGEIGHLHANGSNRLCRCGKRGCFDTEITYPAIAQKIEEGVRAGHFKAVNNAIEKNGGFNIKIFTDACNAGDPDALELMSDTINSLCAAISWVYYMIDPAVVFVSSKLDAYTGFYRMIKDTLYKRYENNFTYGKLEVKPAPFGEALGAIGAAAYVYEVVFGTILG